jgi:hypothetical protein
MRCEVCFEEGGETACQQCGRQAHAECYPFDKGLCQPCAGPGEARCRYCRHRGLLHRISEEEFSHFCCGLFSEELERLDLRAGRL